MSWPERFPERPSRGCSQEFRDAWEEMWGKYKLDFKIYRAAAALGVDADFPHITERVYQIREHIKHEEDRDYLRAAYKKVCRAARSGEASRKIGSRRYKKKRKK